MSIFWQIHSYCGIYTMVTATLTGLHFYSIYCAKRIGSGISGTFWMATYPSWRVWRPFPSLFHFIIPLSLLILETILFLTLLHLGIPFASTIFQTWATRTAFDFYSLLMLTDCGIHSLNQFDVPILLILPNVESRQTFSIYKLSFHSYFFNFLLQSFYILIIYCQKYLIKIICINVNYLYYSTSIYSLIS